MYCYVVLSNIIYSEQGYYTPFSQPSRETCKMYHYTIKINDDMIFVHLAFRYKNDQLVLLTELSVSGMVHPSLYDTHYH